MKKLLFFSIVSTCCFLSVNAQINIQWQKRYSSAGSNVDRAEDLFMDAAGNTYVTGIGKGASGNLDYVTIKYDPLGTQVWKSEYNGPGNSMDEAHAIKVDAAGNVYVTGWSYGGTVTGYDYATVKYNSAGVQQWASRYTNTAGGTDEAWDVGVDNAGNVFVTGSSDGAGTNSAIATIRYNSAGAQQFAIRHEGVGGGIDAGYSIFVDAVSGFSYVAGYTFQSAAQDFNYVTLKYNLAGVQQWVSRYNGPDSKYDEARSITVDGLGNVYVTGYSQKAILTNYDYATVKYNSAGVQQWAMLYNGTGNNVDKSNVVKLDPLGNVYITGRSVGVSPAAEDILTIKYNNSGSLKWSARYNGPANGYDEGKDLAVDAAGNVYVTGYSFTIGANNDFTTIKYDSTGVQQWLTKYNGTGNNTDQAVGIAIDGIGNVFIAGLSIGAGTDEDYETIKYCQLTANAGADTTICNGSSVQLNASAPGAVSYAWTPSTGLSFTNIAHPIATPTVTTTYQVAITNGSGCVDLDSVVVTVVPLPAPGITTSGPTSFCIGGSVTLNSVLATSYQWSSGVNDTLQSITVTTSGNYAVTINNGAGCSSHASIDVSVFDLPPVDAGLNDSICLSTNITLGASGGVTYVWSPAGSLSDPAIANPVAGPTVTTTYTVVGTATGGCSNTDSVTITVLEDPDLPAIIRNVDTLFCSSDYSGYQWYLNDEAIPGATRQDYTFTANGTYYLQVFNASGCSTSSTTTVITDVGIDENSNAIHMIAYPNPTSSYVTLQFNLVKQSDVKIKVTNIAGELVYSDELRHFIGAYKRQISLHENAIGVYYLQVTTNDEVINKKLIKQ